MKRTFNFTERRRINRKDLSIVLRPTDGRWEFDGTFSLREYAFPETGEIWVEAYRQNLWMQWPWGTIGNPVVPADRVLSEFDVPDGVLFRVRVVQPPGPEHHKLLGEADGIPFVMPGDVDDRRRHLLVPEPDELGQLAWKLDFDSEPPRLKINRDARPSWKEMARSPQFMSLVFPEILRQMLLHVLFEEKWSEEDDEEGSWQTNWILFAKNLGALGEVPRKEAEIERKSWVDEAVRAFSRRQGSLVAWNRTIDDEVQP